MKNTKKLLRSIKNNGIKSTINKVAYKIKIALSKTVFTVKKLNINNEIDFKKYKRVIIFENQFGWNRIMKQRPQQMANATDSDTLFIYGTPYTEIGHTDGLKKIKDNLYLVDLVIYKENLINSLKSFRNKYLMIYSTDYIPLDILKPYLDAQFKVIYEYVDGIDDKLCGEETGKLLRERHEIIVKEYNPYIVVTATKLLNNIKELKKDANVKLITNGVDYKHFAEFTGNIPESIEKIKKKNNVILGYYGALASWFDYKLIEKLAKSDKNYQIVLIGLDYDKTLDKSKILDLPNVHFLGKKEYNDLPQYLHAFDICMIPFVINEITLSTSPVKAFEYMAARKPIVTTDLPECRKYKSILIGKDDNDFVQKIKNALDKRNDEKYLDILTKEAKENEWQNKFKELINLISSGESYEG